MNWSPSEAIDISIQPVSIKDEDIQNTIAVMGGEDWKFWMEDLKNAGVLAEGVKTVAYSYIGPELTFPIYRNGTIGQAKNDLEGSLNSNQLIRLKIEMVFLMYLLTKLG
ncbi:hypothetical protein FQR65_LT17987 [Abscondita terminalis]|nr:hypothetical protein FQR65_LT17987 [Abscondita terminalis]